MAQTAQATLDAVPLQQLDVRTEVIEGELLLYHPLQTKAVYLNPPAAVVWTLCDGQRRARDIVEVIADSYPAAREDLDGHVLGTIQQLCDDGVLTLR